MTARIPRAWIDALESALRGSRPHVLEAWSKRVRPGQRKDDGSIVTDLDLVLERTIAPGLLAIDATHGLVSEEGGVLREGSLRWVLDPLDGSANFAARVGCFVSQAALVEPDGTPLLAAIYEPLHDDYTWAARGEGCWREGLRVTLMDAPLDEALIYIDLPSWADATLNPALIREVGARVAELRSLGSIGLHLRDVATGAAQGFLGRRGQVSSLHDIAPGALLVREAGGGVWDFEGREDLGARTSMVAGGASLRALILELMKSAED